MLPLAKIVIIGTNYNNLPIEKREKIDPKKMDQIIKSTLYPKIITEWAILSTCNRTEIYAATSSLIELKQKIALLLSIEKYYQYVGSNAVFHLFSVAAGIDSRILGESDILAQIKDMYHKAHSDKTIKSTFHRLFQDTIRVGKMVRSKTHIGEGITTTEEMTLFTVQNAIGSLIDKKVLVIGAGAVAQRMLKVLHYSNIKHITVINRTYTHTLTITKKFGGKTGRFDSLPKHLLRSDVIITATSSKKSIITVPMIKKIIKKRKSPLCLIDLAVPRNIVPSVSQIRGVYLFNIDDIQEQVTNSTKKRNQAANQAKKLLEKEVNSFLEWYKLQKAVPILKLLVTKSNEIKNKELEKALFKLSHLNNHDKRVVTILAHRLENKLLAQPLANIKTLVSTKKDDFLEFIKAIFGL